MPRAEGQGSTFTPEVAERILRALRNGAYFRSAALAAGVKPETAEDWLYRGRGGRKDEPRRAELVQFAQDVEAATASFEVNALEKLQQLAVDQPGGWRAILEVLSRRQPEEWGDTKRIEVAVQKVAREEIARELVSIVEDAVNDPAMDAHFKGPGARKAVLTAIAERLVRSGSGAPSPA